MASSGEAIAAAAFGSQAVLSSVSGNEAKLTARLLLFLLFCFLLTIAALTNDRRCDATKRRLGAGSGSLSKQ